MCAGGMPFKFLFSLWTINFIQVFNFHSETYFSDMAPIRWLFSKQLLEEKKTNQNVWVRSVKTLWDAFWNQNLLTVWVGSHVVIKILGSIHVLLMSTLESWSKRGSELYGNQILRMHLTFMCLTIGIIWIHSIMMHIFLLQSRNNSRKLMN